MPPKLICLTPVRNEDWILEAFLTSTQQWADKIIIADQNSTDNSKSIAKSFDKVVIIENKDTQFNEPERQSLLINESRKIRGDKILITLDADEMFSGGFLDTADWKKIINSRPGDMFGFQWANITPDLKHYFPSSFHFPWAFHDDGTEHGNYVQYIHSMRIPYPIKYDKTGWYKVNDFKVLHFNYANKKRLESKNRFYQCLVKYHEPKKNPIALFRSHYQKTGKTFRLPKNWLLLKDNQNICEYIRLSDTNFWFDQEVLNMFVEKGPGALKLLDIWGKDWLAVMNKEVEIKDPRKGLHKIFHHYLRLTAKIAKWFPVKVVDKLIYKLLIK